MMTLEQYAPKIRMPSAAKDGSLTMTGLWERGAATTAKDRIPNTAEKPCAVAKKADIKRARFVGAIGR